MATVLWIRPTNAIGRYQDNRITKSGGTGGTFDGGAISAAWIASGDGDVQTTADVNTTERAFGLAAYAAITTYTQMIVSVRLGAAGTYQIYEGSTLRVAAAAYAAADVFKLSIESGVYKVYQNGVLKWTSALTVVYPVRAAAAFATASSIVDAATIAGGVADSVALTAPSNPSAMAATFTAPSAVQKLVVPYIFPFYYGGRMPQPINHGHGFIYPRYGRLDYS